MAIPKDVESCISSVGFGDTSPYGGGNFYPGSARYGYPNFTADGNYFNQPENRDCVNSATQTPAVNQPVGPQNVGAPIVRVQESGASEGIAIKTKSCSGTIPGTSITVNLPGR